MKEPIHVGVLLDAESLQMWQYRTLKSFLNNTNSSVDILVVNDTNHSKKLKERIKTHFMDFSIRKFYTMYRIILENIYGPVNARKTILIDDIHEFRNAKRISCEPISANSFGNKLPDYINKQLVQLDVVIRFGFGFLVGDALNAPKHGILSFHHGDLREYRGGPFGFWEFLHGKDTAGVTVQRINEDLDGGKIVSFKRVDISNAISWPEVQSLLLNNSDDLLLSAIMNLMNEDFIPHSPENLGTLYTAPEGTEVLYYFIRRLSETIEKYR